MRDGRTVKPAAATKRASLGSGRKWARKSAGIRETPEYYAWNDPDAPVEMSAAERQRLNQVALGVSGRAELEAEARRLVDLRHRLAFITDVAGSKSAAAELLGVDPSQTTRWAKGDSNPGPVQVRRLIDLDHVLAHAALVWSTESLVRDWLTTSNAHLEGARPIDYLRLHGAADVIGALRAEAAGSYA